METRPCAQSRNLQNGWGGRVSDSRPGPHRPQTPDTSSNPSSKHSQWEDLKMGTMPGEATSLRRTDGFLEWWDGEGFWRMAWCSRLEPGTPGGLVWLLLP